MAAGLGLRKATRSAPCRTLALGLGSVVVCLQVDAKADLRGVLGPRSGHLSGCGAQGCTKALAAELHDHCSGAVPDQAGIRQTSIVSWQHTL